MGASRLSTTVECWLDSHARRHAWLSIAGSAASLLGGIVVLYITYWFVTMLMLPQLCLIDGLVILRSDPVGVAITDGLRETIGVWRAAHKDDE